MTDETGRLAVAALENLKGQDITILDVAPLSEVMDNLIVATGTSNRHVSLWQVM